MKIELNYFIILIYVLFVLPISCGPGGGGSPPEENGRVNVSGSYVFSYSYEFTATIYPIDGDCITSTEIENSISPFVIEQIGEDLTFSDESCFGIIDSQSQVIFYCEDIEYVGKFDQNNGEIVGTLSGEVEVSNSTSTGECISIGNANGTFSLIPV